MSKTWKIIIFVLSFIIVLGLFLEISSGEKNKTWVLNGFTMFGTLLSLWGICLAYMQIHSVKETSEKIQSEVANSIKEINEFFSFSDISTTIERIREIHNYIIINKIELALLRMKDLKIQLINIHSNSKLGTYIDCDAFKLLIRDINLDISHIHDHLLRDKNVNLSMVNKHLETTSTSLEEIVSKIKNSKL
ncbi:hypothetical protein CLV62_12452 [Dysgonomonas alginatilytica]|uniref:Uncharacterized protein n=1 Tax=Dysgonomonas alginatilytica TaxID=1605892 RepID=A0A2V3PMH6_9BACT|nr:hypothetical protein [Dysgonomonas alginatilytica]PXV61897.1 hypothetical protein CLV62_12452 [Dysgonomonas alginatilytica]